MAYRERRVPVGDQCSRLGRVGRSRVASRQHPAHEAAQPYRTWMLSMHGFEIGVRPPGHRTACSLSRCKQPGFYDVVILIKTELEPALKVESVVVLPR